MGKFCSEDGKHCLQFAGRMQLTTFTRWCFLLQGVYYWLSMAENLHPILARVNQVLFGLSFSSALLVTLVTYGVLVPAALLIDHPPHMHGNIQILMSPQGHIMHSMNTVFIV